MKAPTFPRTDTLTARALMRLLTGQQFTHRDFQSETASSSPIEQLRNRHGWPIESKEETALTTDKVPRIATYARYFIEPEVLEALRGGLGERMGGFVEAVKVIESRGRDAA